MDEVALHLGGFQYIVLDTFSKQTFYLMLADSVNNYYAQIV